MPPIASRTLTAILLAFATAILHAPIAVADTKLSPRNIRTIDPKYFGAILPIMLSPMRDTYSDDAKPVLIDLLEHNVQACGQSGKQSLQVLDALTDFCVARAQYDEALNYREKFQGISDDYVSNLLEMATIKLAAGRIRGALMIMEKLPEIQTNTPLGRDNLVTAAAIYLEANERDKAQALLQKLYDIDIANTGKPQQLMQPSTRLRCPFTTERAAYLWQQLGDEKKAEALWQIISRLPSDSPMQRRLQNPPSEPWYMHIDGRWYCLTIDTDRITMPGHFADNRRANLSARRMAMVEGPVRSYSWTPEGKSLLEQALKVQKEAEEKILDDEDAAQKQADLKSYERVDYATARIHTMQKLTEMQRQADMQNDKSKERR